MVEPTEIHGGSGARLSAVSRRISFEAAFTAPEPGGTGHGSTACHHRGIKARVARRPVSPANTMHIPKHDVWPKGSSQ